MNKIFQFGQHIDAYDFKVINERDARASAGIMFLLGVITLFSFFMSGNLFWANLFTITFILEFVIRVFMNPIYAPYMLLGSLIVSNQEPDWVEAKPKKFAWMLGVILGAIMSYFILFDIVTPARLLTCVLCLFLLYTESVFGICLGCIVYKKFNVKLNKCSGGVCEMPQVKKSNKNKYWLILLFMVVFYGIFYSLKTYKYYDTTNSNLSQTQKDIMEFGAEDDASVESITHENTTSEITPPPEDCTPPQWAIDIGHKDKWIEHNCK